MRPGDGDTSKKYGGRDCGLTGVETTSKYATCDPGFKINDTFTECICEEDGYTYDTTLRECVNCPPDHRMDGGECTLTCNAVDKKFKIFGNTTTCGKCRDFEELNDDSDYDQEAPFSHATNTPCVVSCEEETDYINMDTNKCTTCPAGSSPKTSECTTLMFFNKLWCVVGDNLDFAEIKEPCYTGDCPVGTFRNEESCLPCDNTCLTCSGSADNCGIACKGYERREEG
ncbi:MAG: hypothetical protein V2I33_25405 [Kangiellaceae bacterium]|jgi:hypothetical protein|nr:hypothetical protein [Kangiellaceae bacterium]